MSCEFCFNKVVTKDDFIKMVYQTRVKVLALLLSLCSLLEAGTVPDTKNVCDTPICVKSADEIQGKIDYDVQPCDDFYRFACGHFIKKTKIPDDKVIVDSFSTVGDALKEQLKTIITSPVEDSDIEPFKMVKRLYSACMNKGEVIRSFKFKNVDNTLLTDLIEQRGLKPINDIMELMGGWPAVKGDAWDEKAWTWQKSILDCRKNGYSNDFLIDFSVNTDLKNSKIKLADVKAFLLQTFPST